MKPGNIRRAFTKWHIKRGYTFGYDFTHVPVYSDGFLSTPCGVPESRFRCPWWVKPLLIFFSPSVYFAEAYGKNFVKWFEEGLRKGLEERKSNKIL